MDSSFTLTIALGNDDTLDDCGEISGHAIANYLRSVSVKLRDGHTSGSILDGNGNTVGSWQITP